MQSLFICFIAPFLSILACLLIAKLVYNSSHFESIFLRNARFGSLDGIRGYLAIFVLFHHFIIVYGWQKEGFWGETQYRLFNNFGKVSVAIFFMITGFLFIAKITQKKVNWLQLYKSRLFRIMPLYLFSVAIISFVVFTATNFALTTDLITLMKQYTKWLLFFGGNINGFDQTNLVIAGVEWTLKFEWFFYLSLPFIATAITRLKTIGVAILIILSVLAYTHSVSMFVLTSVISSKYIIFFCFGGIASYIYKKYNDQIEFDNVKLSFFNLTILLVALLYPHTYDIFHILIIFLFFIVSALGNDLFGLFSKRSSILLGEISYSIYLLHGAVLFFVFKLYPIIEFKSYTLSEYFVFMPMISVIVILLSVVTFLTIEKPFIKLGSKL